MKQVERLFICACVAVGLAPAQKTEVVLHRFKASLRGSQPEASLFRDEAGNLYGTTQQGGPANRGLVFKIGADGHERTLYSFQPGTDGASPVAGVIRDADGNLYGTTEAGGTANAGTVYKVEPGGQETVLYSFTGGTAGGNPRAGVIRDSAGNLYGTTAGGGTAGNGVVYKLDPSGQETVLYSFIGGTDGSQPYGGVIRDSAGNLYGTTTYGGTAGDGIVFSLSPSGQKTVLYNFTGGLDGGQPAAALIRDSAGNLYGTTIIGGQDGSGTVFTLSPSGQETVLYSSVYGVQPFAGVVRDSSGNLYGTTANPDEGGYVFKVSASGQATVLLNFTGDNGGDPNGVILDEAGNLYGTTREGGKGGAGVVYKLDSAGQETVLYTFPYSGNGGNSPQSGVIRDAAGNLYGTTPFGGKSNAGVVFKLDPAGQETVLYSFTGGADGGNPYAGVIFDSAGNLYGTTHAGGASNTGVVFKLDPAGQETVLYSFTGGADGGNPYAGVIFDAAGNLYGTTFEGGAANAGVVFQIDPTGLETVLHSFSGGADGGYPYAGLALDASGNLYGTTADGGVGYGVVFKVDPAGQETVLDNFKRGGGQTPLAGVILDAAGNLYGTTAYSGGSRGGTVYRVDTAGRAKVLYDFSTGVGSNVYGGLALDSAGNLYGTTASGGADDLGVVFKLDPSGRHETVLHQFHGHSDGAIPYGTLILDSAGNIYGTTSQGGADNGGIVFELEP
jgi:uncharacterized repeat protein (TIGR03803 family)